MHCLFDDHIPSDTLRDYYAIVCSNLADTLRTTDIRNAQELMQSCGLAMAHVEATEGDPNHAVISNEQISHMLEYIRSLKDDADFCRAFIGWNDGALADAYVEAACPDLMKDESYTFVKRIVLSIRNLLLNHTQCTSRALGQVDTSPMRAATPVETPELNREATAEAIETHANAANVCEFNHEAEDGVSCGVSGTPTQSAHESAPNFAFDPIAAMQFVSGEIYENMGSLCWQQPRMAITDAPLIRTSYYRRLIESGREKYVYIGMSLLEYDLNLRLLGERSYNCTLLGLLVHLTTLRAHHILKSVKFDPLSLMDRAAWLADNGMALSTDGRDVIVDEHCVPRYLDFNVAHRMIDKAARRLDVISNQPLVCHIGFNHFGTGDILDSLDRLEEEVGLTAQMMADNISFFAIMSERAGGGKPLTMEDVAQAGLAKVQFTVDTKFLLNALNHCISFDEKSYKLIDFLAEVKRWMEYDNELLNTAKHATALLEREEIVRGPVGGSDAEYAQVQDELHYLIQFVDSHLSNINKQCNIHGPEIAGININLRGVQHNLNTVLVDLLTLLRKGKHLDDANTVLKRAEDDSSFSDICPVVPMSQVLNELIEFLDQYDNDPASLSALSHLAFAVYLSHYYYQSGTYIR